MSQVVTNPLPKTRFQETDKNVTKHRDLIGSDNFQRAIDFALLQYQAQVALEPLNGNFNAAAAAHFRQLGALEFVQTLRLLAESPTPRSVSNTDNLDHKLK